MRELLDKLAKEPMFGDLREWRVVPLHAERVVRLSLDQHDYVAKLAAPYEIEVHRRLAPLGLKNIASTRFPNLLDEGLLVTAYVPGGPIREPILSQDLVIEMAKVQNRIEPDPQLTNEDRVQWRDFIIDAMDIGRLRLAQARQTGTITELTALSRTLEAKWRQIATEYSQMPFAWLHFDFREANILGGPPQTVIDWGSSQGVGPFLHDMARFCLADGATFRTFSGVSDICRRSSDSDLGRWLYVGACANLAMMLKHLEEHENDLGRLVPFYRTLLGA